MDKMGRLAGNPIKPGELAVVIGSGASGFAAAALLRRLGARVRLLDKNPNGFSADFLSRVSGLELELVNAPHVPEQFAGAALVVPSPGVPARMLEELLKKAGTPVCVSELELAAWFAHEKIVAVTGTSGKTTTVSLIAEMLKAGGKKVFLGGNIGTPLSEYILQRESGGEMADVLVLEVSSFQLQLARSFHPQVALMLNLSENHLDQHRSMDEYRDAKLKIFANQTPADLAILGEDLFYLAQNRPLRARVEYFAAPLGKGRFAGTRLLGRHNQANLEAAWLAAREFGVSEKDAIRAAASFPPMPHRLESVGEWNGVLYVNDSKATTVEALRVALMAMERPVLLLAGGVFKGGALESLQDLLKEKVRSVALFGKNRELFEHAWSGSVPVNWDPTLEEAMRRARAQAMAGDVILMSPATSSFDLYNNYKERGNDFKRVAEILK